MFKLADYYHAGKLKLTNELGSEYTFECPVCGGKLKCHKSTGKYSCYTGYCSPNAIRTKLGANPITTTNLPPPVSSFIKPIITTSLDPPIKRTSTYQLPKVRQLSDRTITTYIFSTLSVVERVDYVDKSRKKELYPKYRTNVNSNWTYGRSNNFGLYGSVYIGDIKGSVLMAEGEKCADYVMQHTDYVCLSAPTFAQEDVSYIASNLTNPKITSVIFLPDNDEQGRKKANAVMVACWTVNKSCFIFDYGEAAHTMNDGNDIVDIAGRGYDIRRLIDDYYLRYIN